MKNLEKFIIVWFSFIGESEEWFHECDEKEFNEVFHGSMDELIKYHKAAGHEVKNIEIQIHEMNEG